MSFFVTRPAMPVPSTCAMSTPFSCAIFRTSGEDRVRMRSSIEERFEAEGAPCTAGAAAGAGGGAAAGAAGVGDLAGGCAGGASGAGTVASVAGAFAAGAGASAGAAGAAGFSPASPMRPTIVLIATVSPGLTRISTSVPAAGEGISASTLSVEISNSGSSRPTMSPTFLSHLVIVPSAMDSPICGMITSVAMDEASLLQVVLEEIRDPPEHVLARPGAAETVLLPELDLQIVAHARLREGVDHREEVLRMDVVVGCPLEKEQSSTDVSRRPRGRGPVVTVGVLHWRAHVALRVGRVVETPVGDRRPRDGAFPRAGRMGYRIKRHVSAVGPAPHGKARGIDIGELAQRFDTRELVLELDPAQVAEDRRLEGMAPPPGAAIVELPDEVPPLCQILIEKTGRSPGVGDGLGLRAAVDVDDDGVAARGIEPGRTHEPAVQDGAVLRRHVHPLR